MWRRFAPLSVQKIFLSFRRWFSKEKVSFKEKSFPFRPEWLRLFVYDVSSITLIINKFIAQRIRRQHREQNEKNKLLAIAKSSGGNEIIAR